MISLNGVRCIFRVRYNSFEKVSFFPSYSTSSSTWISFARRSIVRGCLRLLQMSTFFFAFASNSNEQLEKQKKKHKMKNGERAVAITTHNENENRNNTQVWKRLRHNRVRMFCVCAHFNTCNSRNRSLNRFARHAIAWHGNGYVCIWYVGCLKAPSSNKTTAITRTLQPVRTAQPNIFRFLPFLFSVQCYYICTYVKR